MAQKRSLSPEQDRAANPAENVWVQANAGTGKTSVLIQRLLRILFRTDELEETGILCLTYTNAGAGEMRNRILRALREWATADDAELSALLAGISEQVQPTAADLTRARRIFFKYIDNPEILKIKTIHGFCEEILHRFPLEAGVSPAWSLVSDASQRVLMQDAFDKLINTSQKNISDNARINDAFAHIVGRVSETYMDDLLKVLSTQYKHFFDIKNIDNYRNYFIDTTKYFLNLNFDISDDFAPEKLKFIINAAQEDINIAKKPAQYLINIINLTKQYIDKTIDFEKYKTAYLKADSGKISAVSKKEYLVAEQERVYDLNQYMANRRVFEDTVALFDLSAAFTKTYQELKSHRNLLDFEDLILYTRRLFSNPDTMGWVLSQLNISLSHILVDEAQDTSPLQWDILRMLSGDFFAEGDTQSRRHSLFVVGDTKQSIYGFQGADPRAFASSREEIAAQIKNNMRTIAEIPLAQSFRSLGAILHTVDVFFGDSSVVAKTGFVNNPHKCFRVGKTGLVEMHKLASKQDHNIDVLDYIRTIADKIKSLIDSGECTARDIMVLVQNRHPMAPILVNELKRRGIDVAGSDRIILPDFPAVRDLMNLVRFCLNTNDDYSLCCVLKSPFFRLTEQNIFNICSVKNAANKDKKSAGQQIASITVFDVLQDMHPDIFTVLCEIVQWSESMAPYSFFTRVLNTNGIRESMIAALGGQIVDPLEEFMTICLAYERTQTGTLRHFLKWFITGGSEIKRDMDASSGVRVVTVHGSKGLEAPVVFLIDTVRTPKSENILPIVPEMLPESMRRESERHPMPWLWVPRADDSMRRADAANALMDARIAEYYRLLYVAMTRARDRLYIYGFTPHKNAPEMAWHSQLWRVLQSAPGAEFDGETIRIKNG